LAFPAAKKLLEILEGGGGRENKIEGCSIFHSKIYREGNVFVAFFQAQIWTERL
jgi:hypothetical protein